MQENNTFMKTKPVFSLLVSMSVPMMLSMLIQSLYNIVDSIYVSRLGTDALTAVSLAYPLQNAILSVAVGIGVGISSAISIHLGAGNQEKADRAATIGIALTVFHCLLFILAGLFITRPFLSLFTDNPAVLGDSCDYTYIVLCFSFGSLLQIAFEKIFQGIGQMKVTMYLLIVGCVVNIILDPILIFGLLGFPALGVAGAAIATVIGQISAFLLYIVVYLRKPYAIHIRAKHLRFDWKMIRQIYSVGIPSSIMMLLPSVLISILNSILAAFSEVYVAVLGVYFKLQTFIYMPATGSSRECARSLVITTARERNPVSAPPSDTASPALLRSCSWAPSCPFSSRNRSSPSSTRTQILCQPESPLSASSASDFWFPLWASFTPGHLRLSAADGIH